MTPVGYSYWRNSNAHEGGNDMWIFLSLNSQKRWLWSDAVPIEQGHRQHYKSRAALSHNQQVFRQKW